MSVKRFCDVCNKEITHENKRSRDLPSDRLMGESHGLAFVITTGRVEGRNKIWNAGDFCDYCIIDAVNSLDNRARPK